MSYCIYPYDNDTIILITIYFRIKTFETWEVWGGGAWLIVL